MALPSRRASAGDAASQRVRLPALRPPTFTQAVVQRTPRASPTIRLRSSRRSTATSTPTMQHASSGRRAKQFASSRRCSSRQQEQRMQRGDLQAETIREFQASQTEARKAIPDFEAVVSKAQIPVARHVGELILESDKAGLLQYHLATTSRAGRRAEQLSPADAARRIGRLEARLSLSQTRTATKAPPPSAKLRGGATPSSPDADLDAWLTKKYGKK
jgi:hypothetical protein